MPNDVGSAKTQFAAHAEIRYPTSYTLGNGRNFDIINSELPHFTPILGVGLFFALLTP